MLFILSQIGPYGLVVNILAVTYMLVLGASAVEDKNNSDIMLVSLPIKKIRLCFQNIFLYMFSLFMQFL